MKSPVINNDRRSPAAMNSIGFGKGIFLKDRTSPQFSSESPSCPYLLEPQANTSPSSNEKIDKNYDYYHHVVPFFYGTS
jgi:hypothetical protein